VGCHGLRCALSPGAENPRSARMSVRAIDELRADEATTVADGIREPHGDPRPPEFRDLRRWFPPARREASPGRGSPLPKPRAGCPKGGAGYARQIVSYGLDTTLNRCRRRPGVVQHFLARPRDRPRQSPIPAAWPDHPEMRSLWSAVRGPPRRGEPRPSVGPDVGGPRHSRKQMRPFPYHLMVEPGPRHARMSPRDRLTPLFPSG